MKKSGYMSIQELAAILGISRIAVYKRVKKGEIKAVRIGRSFAIPRKYIDDITGTSLGAKEKNQIDAAVKRTVNEYGEVLKLLGRE